LKNSSDTLEELTSILDELRDRPEDAVILVEGQKDRGALIALGIGGEVWHVKGGG